MEYPFRAAKPTRARQSNKSNKGRTAVSLTIVLSLIHKQASRPGGIRLSKIECLRFDKTDETGSNYSCGQKIFRALLLRFLWAITRKTPNPTQLRASPPRRIRHSEMATVALLHEKTFSTDSLCVKRWSRSSSAFPRLHSRSNQPRASPLRPALRPFSLALASMFLRCASNRRQQLRCR